jgi:hypothetical protein
MAKDKDNGNGKGAVEAPVPVAELPSAEDLNPETYAGLDSMFDVPMAPEAAFSRVREATRTMRTSKRFRGATSETSVQLFNRTVESLGIRTSLEITLDANLRRVFKKPFNVRMLKELEETSRLSRQLLEAASGESDDPERL